MKNNLFDLFGRYGLAPLLLHTKTLVVLARSNGELLEWNPTFGRLKESLPDAGRLHDFLTDAGRTRLTGLLRTRPKQNGYKQASLEICGGSHCRWYYCLLIYTPNGNFIFTAEPVLNAPGEDIARLSHDLRAARHALRIRRSGIKSHSAQPQETIPHDPLAFPANRSKIVADLQCRVALSNNTRKPLTIFMLEIDHFRQINDAYGRMTGDYVLRTLAHRLRDSMRQTDALGVYSGEGFLALLPGASLEQASQMAERLLEVARNTHIEVADQVVRTTLSIGIAEYRFGERWQNCVERALTALRQLRENGGDRWSAS